MENPFEHIAKELAIVKAQQAEILLLLNNLPTGIAEKPISVDEADTPDGEEKTTKTVTTEEKPAE